MQVERGDFRSDGLALLARDVSGATSGSDSRDRLYAHTENSVVDADSDGEERWPAQFDERVVSHRFDDKLLVGTDEATRALEPT